MTLLALANRAASGRAVAALLAALVAATSTAGWALWRLAGAGTRCDLRIAVATDAGNAAIRQLVEGRAAALALLEYEHSRELSRLRAASAGRAVERVIVYRDRIDTIEVPVCTVAEEQIAQLIEVLR